jgi:hypothetical protein
MATSVIFIVETPEAFRPKRASSLKKHQVRAWLKECVAAIPT